MVVYLSCDLKGFTSTYLVFDVQSTWVTNQTDNSFAKLRASDGTQIFGWHFSFAYFNAKIMRCPLLLMGKSASILFWVSRAGRAPSPSVSVPIAVVKHSPRNFRSSSLEQNLRSFPVSTSSTRPSNLPSSGLVVGPSRTTKAHRITFTEYGYAESNV